MTGLAARSGPTWSRRGQSEARPRRAGAELAAQVCESSRPRGIVGDDLDRLWPGSSRTPPGGYRVLHSTPIIYYRSKDGIAASTEGMRQAAPALLIEPRARGSASSRMPEIRRTGTTSVLPCLLVLWRSPRHVRLCSGLPAICQQPTFISP
jgi:hypothetical protein